MRNESRSNEIFCLGANQMTVGKIYCAKLIYENYRHLKKQGKESFKVLIKLVMDPVAKEVEYRQLLQYLLIAVTIASK